MPNCTKKYCLYFNHNLQPVYYYFSVQKHFFSEFKFNKTMGFFLSSSLHPEFLNICQSKQLHLLYSFCQVSKKAVDMVMFSLYSCFKPYLFFFNFVSCNVTVAHENVLQFFCFTLPLAISDIARYLWSRKHLTGQLIID